MILLVRHPPVAAAGRCYGRLDLVAESAAVADLAARIARWAASLGITAAALAGKSPEPGTEGGPDGGWTIWTSPARRCQAVAEALGPHIVDDRLQELDFGAWEGVAWDDIPRASLDAWAADPWGFAPPGGESGSTLVTRVRAFAAECAGSNCVVITHGGPLKVLGPVLRREEVDLLAAPPPPGSLTPV